MLQIILFILKLAGWILLLILGLLVLVLLAALFTPLRYQVETSCRGKLSTLEAGVSFHIFFHLVSGKLQYRDGDLSWNIRIAVIKLGDKAEVEDVEENVEEKIEENIKEIANDLEEVEENEPESTIRPKDSEGEKSKSIKAFEEKKIENDPKSIAADGEKKADRISETPADSLEKRNAEESQDSEKVSQAREKSDHSKNSDTVQEEQNTKESLADKIAGVFEKIKYTFERICAKIKLLLKKAESVKAFLTDEVHQSAFLKCLAELKKMLIRLRPKQVAGEIHFGFEDPSLTGRVLAGVSMLYPYWGDHVCCYPDFDHKVLEGEVSVKGSLRLLPAAVCIWNLLWNKNVRRTIMDVKRFIFK